jgi:hypothetical protein
MRAIYIPLPDFLDAAIHACEVAHSSAKWYLGIVVVLDRKAERRSRLLDELVCEGSSINDVTRKDLLVAIPQQDWRHGVDDWVQEPGEQGSLRSDGPPRYVGAPGLVMSGVDHDAWASRLWELVSDKVEQCENHEDQERITRAIDQSASSVCDFLGLSENDIPSLVVFSLVDRKVFVFRYGGDADDPPYQLFKNIAARRPPSGQRDWLTGAVVDVAVESGLAKGPKPELVPPSLAGWEATRYMPRGVDVLARERARG